MMACEAKYFALSLDSLRALGAQAADCAEGVLHYLSETERLEPKLELI